MPMYIRKSLLASLVAVASASFTASAQDTKRPRIDVEHYTIQAEVDPATQTLRATAVVRFSALDDITTVTFELNNALQISKVLSGTGADLSPGRSQSDFTVRVNLPQALAKGKTETLSFQYQ